jgi:hypothetical protein
MRSPRPGKRRSKGKPVTFETVRRLALALPGIEEGTSYGTPSFRVKGKFIGRMLESGEALVLRLDFETRDALMAADPETFYTTDHYRGYSAVLVRLSTVDPDALRDVIEEAWRRRAPPRLVAAYDESSGR